MIPILDRADTYVKLDPQSVGASMALLHQQVKDGWRAGQSTKIPKSWRNSRELLFGGIGGSALGADILQQAVLPNLPAVVSIVRDYALPRWVTSRTMVIAASYSGTTEETISLAKAARQRHARVLVMATGGTLAKWAKKNRATLILIPTASNPSGQPRLGTGLLIGAELAILKKLGWLAITDKTIQRLSDRAKLTARAFAPSVPTSRNVVKQTALALQGRFALTVAAEHLAGIAHLMANQINENAKTFAAPFVLPELNHHLLEGLTYPASVRHGLAIFMMSRRYGPRIRKRLLLTERLLRKQGLKTAVLIVPSGHPLEEAVSSVAMSSALSYYTGIAAGVNPSKIPWVDEFKRAMK